MVGALETTFLDLIALVAFADDTGGAANAALLVCDRKYEGAERYTHVVPQVGRWYTRLGPYQQRQGPRTPTPMGHCRLVKLCSM